MIAWWLPPREALRAEVEEVALADSFDGLGPDDFMETYERFEDEAIAAELAADHGAEFGHDDL